jgi:rod shape-determining protein MreD
VNSAGELVELLLHHPLRLIGAAVPALLAVLLVMLVNMPVSLTGGLIPAPALALACVYFWVLVRPDLMPPVVVLALGLLEDLLSGGPPGLWAAGFLAALWLTDRQRETFAGLTGAGAVVGFAGAMLFAGAAAYGLDAIVYLRLPPLPPLLLESVSTVVFYPLIAISMGWFHRRIVGPMRSGE